MEQKDVPKLGTRPEPLASEIYGDLKRSDQFKERLIYVLIGVIVLLIIGLIAQGVYHNWRWSQFDRVSVDSSSGPASYVQGENTGGVYFGTSSSTPAQGRPVEGDTDQAE